MLMLMPMSCAARESTTQLEDRPRLLRELLPQTIGSGGTSKARVRSISAGPFSSGALDALGRAWLWGHGLNFQLANAKAAHEATPIQVGGGGGAQAAVRCQVRASASICMRGVA